MKTYDGLVPERYSYWVMALWTGGSLWMMSMERTMLGALGAIGLMTAGVILLLFIVKGWSESDEQYQQGFKDGLYEAHKGKAKVRKA